MCIRKTSFPHSSDRQTLRPWHFLGLYPLLGNMVMLVRYHWYDQCPVQSTDVVDLGWVVDREVMVFLSCRLQRTFRGF